MALSDLFLITFLAGSCYISIIEASCSSSCCLESIQGPPGEAGLPGSPGASGAPGLPGPRGRDGVCACNYHETKKSAFTAIKTESQTGNVGDVVTFDDIRTNVNNNFNGQTSKFVCQHPGTYFFTFVIGIISSNRMQEPVISLLKNGEIILSAHSRTDTVITNDYDQSSNTAIVNLAEGDQVWLAFNWLDGSSIHSNNHRFTSFSGFLLYE